MQKNVINRIVYRISALLICVGLLSVFGCQSQPKSEISSGVFFADGDYQQPVTPYVEIDTEEKTISVGTGRAVDYAERGSFVIRGNELTATTQNGSFSFIIIDKNKLQYKDSSVTGFNLPSDTQFVSEQRN